MCNETPEYEVRIKGHSLVKITHKGVRIDGKDFHSDLKNLSSLIEILNGVLETAQDVKKPRLVADGAKAIPPHTVDRGTPFPYEVITN